MTLDALPINTKVTISQGAVIRLEIIRLELILTYQQVVDHKTRSNQYRSRNNKLN
jgi:hypothetical protein